MLLERPLLSTLTPVLAILLALASTPAQGGTVIQFRGGATSSDHRAAALATTSQSKQQEGSVQSNSLAQGASQRARTGSFVNNAVQINNAATPAASVSAIVTVTKEDRELAAHLADANSFIRNSISDGVGNEQNEAYFLSEEVKDSVLVRRSSDTRMKTFALVDELSKTDEEALRSLFLLAVNKSAARVAEENPELAASLYRLEEKLRDAGLAGNYRFGWFNWSLHLGVAPAILAAPGARPLLHKLTDSEAQQKTRSSQAKLRANILNAAKAQQSFERLQSVKSYLKSKCKDAGVEVVYPTEFMSKFDANSVVTANGGVTLVFNDKSYPIGIRTAHGAFIDENSGLYSSTPAHNLFSNLVEELGLAPVEQASFIDQMRGFREYAITRMPDGSRIPKANHIGSAPVAPKELRHLVSQFPEKVRQGIKVDSN